jgi:hypothetical protein
MNYESRITEWDGMESDTECCCESMIRANKMKVKQFSEKVSDVKSHFLSTIADLYYFTAFHGISEHSMAFHTIS